MDNVSLNLNRQQLFIGIDLLNNYNNIITREKQSNQIGLFGNNVQEQYRPSLPKIEDWSIKDKVINEFEAFGFYLSSHPLDQYKDILEQTNIIHSDSLKDEHQSGYSIVDLAGMIITSKAKVSPKGRYLQAILSDQYGSLEISFFENEVLHEASRLFSQNIPLLIKAEVRKDEGGIRITGQEVEALDDYLVTRLLAIEILVKEKAAIAKLKPILANKASGKVEIILKIITEDNTQVLIDLKQKFKLNINDYREISDIEGILASLKIKG